MTVVLVFKPRGKIARFEKTYVGKWTVSNAIISDLKAGIAKVARCSFCFAV